MLGAVPVPLPGENLYPVGGYGFSDGYGPWRPIPIPTATCSRYTHGVLCHRAHEDEGDKGGDDDDDDNNNTVVRGQQRCCCCRCCVVQHAGMRVRVKVRVRARRGHMTQR